MNEPCTWTTGWELTVEVEGVGEVGGGEHRGESWDNCNRTTIKYVIKNEVFFVA